MSEAINFIAWWNKLPHKYKILIPGNHDFPFDTHLNYLRSMLIGNDSHLLVDQEVIIDEVKFYGSPFTPRYGPYPFMLKRGEEMRRKWSTIPWDVNALITHGPPYGVLDRSSDGVVCGCKELLSVSEWTPLLKLHVFGHIHEAFGNKTIEDVQYVNASLCDRNLDLINEPVVIDI